MTTIIAPSGEAVGTTFTTPAAYATLARRMGWEAVIVGERVYLRVSNAFQAHIKAGWEAAK